MMRHKWINWIVVIVLIAMSLIKLGRVEAQEEPPLAPSEQDVIEIKHGQSDLEIMNLMPVLDRSMIHPDPSIPLPRIEFASNLERMSERDLQHSSIVSKTSDIFNVIDYPDTLLLFSGDWYGDKLYQAAQEMGLNITEEQLADLVDVSVARSVNTRLLLTIAKIKRTPDQFANSDEWLNWLHLEASRVRAALGPFDRDISPCIWFRDSSTAYFQDEPSNTAFWALTTILSAGQTVNETKQALVKFYDTYKTYFVDPTVSEMQSTATTPFLYKPYTVALTGRGYYDHTYPSVDNGGSPNELGMLDYLGRTNTNYDTHDGDDFWMPSGSDVLAPVSGSVLWHNTECVLIGYSQNTYHIVICHLSKRFVVKGNNVTRGELIGKSGTAGGVDHIHFEVRHNGKQTDSMGWYGEESDPCPSGSGATGKYKGCEASVWLWADEDPPNTDTTPPNTSITDGPSGWIRTDSATFQWTGSDNETSTSDLVYRYKLDGHSDWSSWTGSTSKSYSGLSDGSYTFQIKAKDEAGNVDSSPATRSFGVDTTVPSQASNVRPDGWSGPYNDDTTPRFQWDAASDSTSGISGYYAAVDDWTPEGSIGNDWWAGDVTSFNVPNALPEGEHHFAVTSKDEAGNPNPPNTNQRGDAPYYTFYVDVMPPSVPNVTIGASGCSGIQNNVWQNTCYDPYFTWNASDSGSGVKDYHYYWGASSNGSPDTWTSDESFDPDAIASSDGYARYYLNVVARDELDHHSGMSSFGLLYDGTIPNISLQINDGAETTNRVDVLLTLSASDSGSGLDAVRISNNALTWFDWRSYADAIPWTLPTLDRRTHTVYVQVRDEAGNDSTVASDVIYLDLYPPMPHSTNYRICDDVVDAGGSVGVASPSYSLVSAIGQPWATGADGNTGEEFSEQAGFLAVITGCRPISHTVTSNYTVTQWVMASGGNLRGSRSYRIGDTTGQPAASGSEAFSSASYVLSSGFWSQISGTVPPTSTMPTPAPTLIPSPSPTPGPTPTPQPTGFGVSLNDGALYTNDPRVTVRTWAPNVTHLRLSNDGGYAEDDWQTYRVTATWTISTYGSHVMPRYVYAWFRDAGDSIYGPYFDDIIYDPVAPEGEVQVSGMGATTITLSLEAWDDNSGVGQVRVGEDVELTDAAWQQFTDTFPWALEGDVVYVQFRDRAGNESPVYGSDGSTHWTDSHSIYLPLVLRQQMED